MGGGSNDSGSASMSRPLTANERYSALAGVLAPLAGISPEFDANGNIKNPGIITSGGFQSLINNNQYYAPDYVQSQIVDPGSYKGMSNQDYNALEQSILQSRTAPLQYAWQQARTQNNQDMADRGIYTSMNAIRSNNDLADRFLPQLTQAAGEAATQRYGMQQQDLNNNNTYNQNRASLLNQSGQFNAAQGNSYNMENSMRDYNSRWAPANYLKDSYNGTSGNVSLSSGSGGGFNFNI